MKLNRLLCTAIVAAIGMPAFALAQSPAPTAAPTAQQPTEATPQSPPSTDTNQGALHFGADLNFTTSYFFRGYNQEDRGVIFQPNVYFYTDIIDGADKNSTLSGLQAKVGSWNSIHGTATPGSDGDWYESDIYASLKASFGSNYYATALFTYYTYPEDEFQTIQEIGLAGGVNDLTAFWDHSDNKTFTLPVEYGVYWETSDGNGDEDIYTELKLTPTFAFGDAFVPNFGKPTLSIPMVVGGSFDGYYIGSDGHNNTFGYASVGAALSLPMDFVPPKYGTWNLVGGVNYIYLFADSAEAANDGGEDYELQGTIGVSMTY